MNFNQSPESVVPSAIKRIEDMGLAELEAHEQELLKANESLKTFRTGPADVPDINIDGKILKNNADIAKVRAEISAINEKINLEHITKDLPESMSA